MFCQKDWLSPAIHTLLCYFKYLHVYIYLKYIYRPIKAYIGGGVLKTSNQIEACLTINVLLKTKIESKNLVYFYVTFMLYLYIG